MHHYIHKSNKCATLYPLLCDKNLRKGRWDGRVGEEKEGMAETQEVLRQWLFLYAESHRDTSKFLWCTLDDHFRLSYRLSNRVCVRARVCVRECVYVSFYFLAIPLFVVCCFLLCLYNWKISYFSIVVRWTIFDLLKKKCFVAFVSRFEYFVFCFFSWWKKGWILNGGQGYKRHNNNHSVLAWHGNIWLNSEI